MDGNNLGAGIASCVIDCADGVAYAAVVGELDLITSDQVGARLEKLDALVMVLDLSAVTFFDASGLRMLERLRSHYGAGLSIASPSNAVKRVLRLTATTGNYSSIF